MTNHSRSNICAMSVPCVRVRVNPNPNPAVGPNPNPNLSDVHAVRGLAPVSGQLVRIRVRVRVRVRARVRVRVGVGVGVGVRVGVWVGVRVKIRGKVKARVRVRLRVGVRIRAEPARDDGGLGCQAATQLRSKEGKSTARSSNAGSLSSAARSSETWLGLGLGLG